MRFRLGRHRRRNLYALNGSEPSDADLFVALFDDEHMAARVMRLLNADEVLAEHASPYDLAIDLVANLGDHVRSRRWQLNVPQIDVVDATGLSHRLISQLERGIGSAPSRPSIVALLEWLRDTESDQPRPGHEVKHRSEAALRGWDGRRVREPQS
jgi:hypothetical protein